MPSEDRILLSDDIIATTWVRQHDCWYQGTAVFKRNRRKLSVSCSIYRFEIIYGIRDSLKRAIAFIAKT
jgi:hypothetical protein